MFRSFLLTLAFLAALTSWAVPARRATLTVAQPDGTVLTLQLVGDEYAHYYLDVATGQALRRNADGWYVPVDASALTAQRAVASQRRSAANAARAAAKAAKEARPMSAKKRRHLEDKAK